MTFNVIDPKTGQYPDLEHIARTEECAQNITPRYDPVFCTDGNKLCLVDEFGCSAKCPDGRFQIKY